MISSSCRVFNGSSDEADVLVSAKVKVEKAGKGKTAGVKTVFARVVVNAEVQNVAKNVSVGSFNVTSKEGSSSFDSAQNQAVRMASRKIGKKIAKGCVMVGVCPGFVGNRILFQRRIEADRIILEGATPAQVDRVLFDFGFPMGPFAMSDLAGLDIGWKEELSNGETLRDLMCESGRRGQKNGRGYYTYDPETRAATPDPEVEQIIKDFAIGKGIEQREVSDQEVLERCLYPMINEGAKILEEGIAIRGSDIDVTWVNGYGWPVYRGGPMHWADSVGLAEIVEKVKGYNESLGGRHWRPSPLLERLAAEGGRLSTYTS